MESTAEEIAGKSEVSVGVWVNFIHCRLCVGGALVVNVPVGMVMACPNEQVTARADNE